MNVKFVLLGFLSAFLLACGGSETDESTGGNSANDTCSDLNSDSFNCTAMLRDIKSTVALKTTILKNALTDLSTEVDEYCLDTSASPASVQSEFEDTMAIVQQLEPLQFGPYADVRDDFYVWPSNSLCRIDDQIATNPNADISGILPRARSLTAVEYLLFSEDVALQCQRQSDGGDILGVTEWYDSTELNERKDARCTYAKNIVDDLEIKAATLESDFKRYDFTTEYSNLQEAANSISDALFYIDKQTKDAKIRDVLPQTTNEEFNLTKVESQFAHITKDNILNNMLGAEDVILAGLNDYLAEKGQSDLVEKMVQAVVAVKGNVDAISTDMHTLVSNAEATDVEACINVTDYTLATNDLQRVCALQSSMKEFTDLLKKDFVHTLSFIVPATADGDND